MRCALALERAQSLIEVGEREPLRERIDDGPGDVVARVELDELRAKRSLVVPGRRRPIARDEARPERIEGHRRVAVEDARPKLDRRDVSLADGAQAHDESRLVRAEAGLIGRGHERRIEEGGPLHGVLVREVGADEEAPLSRHRHVGHAVGDQREMALEQLLEPPVPPGEAGDGLAQHAGHFILREREDARHEQAGARAGVREDLLARQVGFRDDPARDRAGGDARFV